MCFHEEIQNNGNEFIQISQGMVSIELNKFDNIILGKELNAIRGNKNCYGYQNHIRNLSYTNNNSILLVIDHYLTKFEILLI